jgi:hypothetical protein
MHYIHHRFPVRFRAIYARICPTAEALRSEVENVFLRELTCPAMMGILSPVDLTTGTGWLRCLKLQRLDNLCCTLRIATLF